MVKRIWQYFSFFATGAIGASLIATTFCHSTTIWQRWGFALLGGALGLLFWCIQERR